MPKVPSWLQGRTILLLTAAVVLVAVAVVIFVYAATSGHQGGPNTSQGPSSVVLTVDEAVAAEQGQPLNVEGAVLFAGGKTVMASTLAESNPPQAGGVTLPVEGLQLGDLVGLSSSAGQAGAANVTWSDFPLVVQGVVTNGVLQVKDIPLVVEDTSLDSVKIRFSPVSEPISSGDQVWWVFDVTNTGKEPLSMVFSDGQHGDVTLSQNGENKYTWSTGRMFTQVVENITLQPDQVYSIVLSDTLNLPPGDYDLAARVTALIGPSGHETRPPDLETSITVF